MVEVNQPKPTVLHRAWEWIRPSHRAMWVFPVVIALIVVVLSSFGISGSSTPLLGPAGGQQSVLAGTPRAVRSDEWLVRTPMIVGQGERNFPRFAIVGVGEHDLSVLGDLPVASWTALFHPQNSVFFVLPIDNAFAFEWWSTGALVLLATYALLLVLLRDWRWSALGSLILWASPFFHWWHYPAMAATVSWALLATATFLSSLNPELKGWHRWWRVSAAAYFGSCFAFVLYPPVQIPVIFVVLALAAGWVVPKLRSGSIDWRTLLLHCAVVGGVVAAIVLLFVSTHRDALTAISQSVYPGDRRLPGGGGSFGLLVDAWYGWSFISNDAGMRPSILNESEASSFLFLGLFAIAGLAATWKFVSRQFRENRGVVYGALAVIAVLFVHIFIGWGPLLTKITLLDRVQPTRALLGLGVAATILLVIIAKSVVDSDIPMPSRVLAGSLTVAVGGFGILWFGLHERNAGLPISRSAIAVALFLFLLPAVLLFWKPLPSLMLLVLIGVALSIPANPLMRGLGPLTNSQLTREVVKLRKANPDGGWLATDDFVAAIITATGANSLSGVNLYPNVDAWRILDPTSSSEFVWNRYAHVHWVFDAAAKEPIFTLLQPDLFEVRVSPCDERLQTLGASFIVSTTPLAGACLNPLTSVEGPRGVPVTIYQRSLGSP